MSIGNLNTMFIICLEPFIESSKFEPQVDMIWAEAIYDNEG